MFPVSCQICVSCYLTVHVSCNPRHRYKAIEVKPAKSGSGENHVEWLKEDPTTNGKSPTKESEPQKKEDSKPAQRKKKNINVE